jgi:hypothetical protein
MIHSYHRMFYFLLKTTNSNTGNGQSNQEKVLFYPLLVCSFEILFPADTVVMVRRADLLLSLGCER